MEQVHGIKRLIELNKDRNILSGKLEKERDKLNQLIRKGEWRYADELNKVKQPEYISKEEYAKYKFPSIRWKELKCQGVKDKELRERSDEPKAPRVPTTPIFPKVTLLWGALALLLLGVVIALLVACISAYASGKTGLIILVSVLLCTGIIPAGGFFAIKYFLKVFGIIKDEIEEYVLEIRYFRAYPTEKAKYDRAYKEWNAALDKSYKGWKSGYDKDYGIWEEEDLRLKQIYENIVHVELPAEIEKLEKQLEENKSVITEEDKLFGQDELQEGYYAKRLSELYNRVVTKRYREYIDMVENDGDEVFPFDKKSKETKTVKVLASWINRDSYVFTDELGEILTNLYSEEKDFSCAIEEICDLIENCHEKIAHVSDRKKLEREEREWREEQERMEQERRDKEAREEQKRRDKEAREEQKRRDKEARIREKADESRAKEIAGLSLCQTCKKQGRCWYTPSRNCPFYKSVYDN